MAADAVKKLGVNNADMVDWAAIASHLGQPEAAPFMKEVAKRTMWRRSLYLLFKGHGPSQQPVVKVVGSASLGASLGRGNNQPHGLGQA